MVNWLRNIAPVLLVFCSLHCAAEEYAESDTVYFYDSWEQMFQMEPDTMMIDLAIDYYSPYELYFESSDKKANKRIKKEYVAATLGDSTWLINSNYLKEFFKGDSKNMNGYVPLFFSEKVAYVVVEENSYAELGDIAFNVISTFNYYIDFSQHKVIKIDEKTLNALLADYNDLRMRFESMKNNKKSSIINDYFFKYVDRANEDCMRPYILDILEGDEWEEDEWEDD